MRKSLTTILTLLLALNSLGAADLMRPVMNLTASNQGIMVQLNFQAISDGQWRHLLEQPASFYQYGYGVAGGPGDAALPMLNVLIPIVQDGSPSISNVLRNDYALSELTLKATPAGHLDSDRQVVDVVAYDWSRVTRSQNLDILPGESLLIKGQRYLPISVHPVQLNSASQSPEVPITIQFEIQGVELGETSLITEDGGLRSVSLPQEQFASKGHYLIISPPQFLDYIQYFADWKLRMGYQVSIVGTAETGSSASAIKEYIQNAWDSGEVRPDYLVIVGDEDQGIPGHYIQNPQGENLVTDHPYTLLEGDDSFPELMVGRLSVDTISELAAFTAKIVAYESSPYMGETAWFERALMISTNWGAASAQATKEWVAAKLVENGFDQVYTAYHPEVSSTSAIATPINNGVGFVNYRGYGMYNGWYGPDFTTTNIYSLIHNGSKTPVITSVVCGGGNFAAPDNDPCFGEAWTRIGTYAVPKGAVAFFGPSELYTHTQFNNVIDIGIYSGIFDKGITTLGEALWNGKFELWRNYHQNSYFPFDQTPEFYHHIYNLLGDPGMQLWTTVPQLLTVSHAPSLTTAENASLITVTDATGQPISGAYVSFYNAENAGGGYTGYDGSINLPFQASSAGEVELTVTGQNLLPYLATLPVTESTEALTLNHWTTELDGQLIAGEASSMSLSLSNAGPELSNVEITFSTETQGIIISEGMTIPTIPAMSIYDLDPVNISASSQLPHGQQVLVNVQVVANGNTMQWTKYLTVQAPVVSIYALNVVGGILDSGDSALVEIEMTNLGGVSSGALTLTPLAHDLISFGPGSLVCPEIDVDATASTTGTLALVFSDQVFPAERLTLQFECVQASGTDTLVTILEVGEPTRYGPSQADDYGYRMFDNWDLGFTEAPIYDWIEINPALGGLGSTIPMNDVYEEGDASRVLNLPFPVTYYGETYLTITVCTNGWAAFGSQSVVNFHNRIIPSPVGPTAMLAPFWDDLTTNPGSVSYKNVAAGEAFVIEWSQMSNIHESNNLSFQIVIYDTQERPTSSGNNDIKFQYMNYENIDLAGNFSTVGIESPDHSTGLLASYNNYDDNSIGNLRNGSALLFTTERGERLPDAVAALSGTSLNFVQNPWTSNRDSLIISNVGESRLAYNINVNSSISRLPPAAPIPEMNVSKTSADITMDPSASREGSDAYGYFWKENADNGGPVFSWIDIENGDNLVVHLGDQDDSSVGPLDIGFEFPYYGEIFSHVFLSSNGTLSFMGNYAPWLNTYLPTVSAPSALVAPWWDDLNNDAGPQGTLYFWTNEYDQCIITWKNFPKYGTSDLYTFQVILDSFGKLIFQYDRVDGVTNSSTIGMQSANRSSGLLIRYNDPAPFEAGTAISIHPPVPWFSATGWSGQLNPGESSAFVVHIQTLNLDPGYYDMPLTLFTSAENYRETDLAVGLDVIHGEHPSGDVNLDYIVNIRDLTDLIDFILVVEVMNENQFEAADMSSDDEVNIIDAILLLEYILDTNQTP
ncbi:MAG: hypothetical protein K9N29_03500 [Candidatus Marinimicrobia bacterium]|nr:hypothetical protein [Candidatus Neomarinimicrobiota bacterium]